MGSINPPFPSATKKWWNKEQPATSPARPELSAKGKSVLITGGGTTGIGGETARYFAQAGASRIGVLGRREGPLLDNKAFIEKNHPGVEVFIKSTDVTDQGAVNVAFEEFTGNGQTKVDVLIHSAATIGPQEPVSTANGEEYLDAINKNISSSFWLARAFLRHAAPDAVAVIISSWAAHWSVNDDWSSYCVSKVAMVRLWDTVGQANPNLAIFHTQPGVVLTEMNKKVGGAASMEGVPIDDGEASVTA